MVSREESRFDQGFNGSHQTMEAEDDDTEVVKNEMPPFHWEDKNFMKQTLKALNKMRKNKQFCDVILRVSFRLYFRLDVITHRKQGLNSTMLSEISRPRLLECYR